jgi:hypothetical protein
MGTAYKADIIAWANEQAALLRSGKLTAIDIDHIAEEIEDVGKSEQRELSSRMAVLLSHLLKWQFQPSHRTPSWKRTIKEQRCGIERRIKKTPSLKSSLDDADWWADAWGDAVSDAAVETELNSAIFPETCPWTSVQIRDEGFLPVANEPALLPLG